MGKALDKLLHDRAEKAKAYKTPHDVERIHHMAAALHYLRDHVAAMPITNSIGKELAAAALKQAEVDAKDIEEDRKALAEAYAADAKAAAEEAEPSNPPRRAPSAPNLSDTRR
jgi:hypothetical protein